MTTAEREVRRRATDYVEGRATLADFALWLAALAWELDNTGDADLRDLVNSLELRIAEFTSGDWSEAELGSLIRVPLSASTVVLTALVEVPGKPSLEYFDRSWTRSVRLAVD